MLFEKNKRILIAVIALVSFSLASAQTLQRKVLFNLNWKFTQGNPANAQTTGFSDAAWQTVCVPHSASYDAPTYTAEHKFYKGDYWYRKKFICPLHAKKVFIRFGAIMQTATVFVNGAQVGKHDNSGYTGFSYDISSAVARGDTTCVAIHCLSGFDTNIPPGGAGGDAGSAPDFELFSGMYRSVWLEFKDSVYIAQRGQRITTPGTTNSAAVRAITTVTNDAASAESVSVVMTLRKAGTAVSTQTSSRSISPKSSFAFDMTTSAISPSLWSPGSPTLYTLQTLLSVGGAVVDSTEEQVGFRFFAWNSGKFSINGTTTEIRGVCLAQYMGWIENAVPDSRFAKQVALIKAMGINSIRCAHYPRAEAFYRACDSLGMLLYVEVPTWGVNGGFSGRSAFWNRLYACDSAMVLDGYNHPSIYAWGLFNEQNENLNSYFTNEMNIIHAIDPVSGSGRVCAVANYSAAATKFTGDIFCDNYNYGFTGLNTEAYGNAMADNNEFGNWFRNYIRGGTMDASPSGEAAQEVNCMKNYYWKTTDNMAGGHFWCFQDYSSGRNSTGREGIVDRIWLPKQVYFSFRNSLMNTATDYWTTGAPNSIELTADLTTLKADGSDISQIVATLRSGTQCVQPNSGCTITFTASPKECVSALFTGHSTDPTMGNPVTVAAEGGRAGILLRTTTTPGTITITVTNSCGLSNPPPITLTSSAVTEPIWMPVSAQKNGPHLMGDNMMQPLKMTLTAQGAILTFPIDAQKTVRLLNCQGRLVSVISLHSGKCLVQRSALKNGILYVVWNIHGRSRQSIINGVR